ncbi:MAG: hypothetical protein CL678_10205 [Bdellovibrionaceae bacterium]|nr:hypothetical protein [Pseudobdellovibrionaceae bacterium]|tara:strand:- start:1914 stop:2453 length:540 start_codon:yes stop_codon:yes gene_type:complete
MGDIQGKVGKVDITWLRPPRGPSGRSVVKYRGESIEVSWRRDRDGIWIELPDGVYGFDVRGRVNDEGTKEYDVIRRGKDQRWSGLSFMRAGEIATAGSGGFSKKVTKLKAEMPGKIVKVLVNVGDDVQKGTPLVVVEAMKMENEIQATRPGKILSIPVSAGDTIESGALLMSIGPEEEK